MYRTILRTLTLALTGLVLLGAAGAAAQTPLTADQFMSQYKGNLARNGANEFTPLTDPAVAQLFTEVLDALLAGEVTTAHNRLADLAALHSVRYELIEIVDAPGTMAVLGFRETEDHATGADFRGWGPALVRVGGATDVAYTAPHPQDDQFSEEITLDAFLDDCCAAFALFSGSRRNSNPDTNGNGHEDSDVAHETDNLFHVLTEHVATLTAADPAFHVQVHASIDRSSEPHVVASDGASPANTDSTHPLVALDDDVDAAGFLTMGVEGWDENTGNQDGDYVNPGTTNVQGDFLETVNQRRSFMHIELERTPREEYDAGSGAGFDGIRGMFASLREDLGPDLRVESLSAPATACAGEYIGTDTPVVVRNFGHGPAASGRVAWYLSQDTVLGVGDRLLARTPVAPLAAGESAEVTSDSMDLPDNVDLGDYFLLAVADDLDFVPERIEGNNVSAPLPITLDCTMLTAFERGSTDGWDSAATGDSCDTGTFMLGSPNRVVVSGVNTQPDGDHSLGGGQGIALYTQHNTAEGVEDVDFGTCSVDSPHYSVDVDADVGFHYYFGQLRSDSDSGDFFIVQVARNGGPYVTELDLGDGTREASWQEFTTFVPAGDTVRFRVAVSDGPNRGDYVEAGIDDVFVKPR